MVQGELADRLERFGLTEAETEVLGALLRLGEAKPETIATKTSVTRRYARTAGYRLQERELVTVEDHRNPTVFRARTPTEIEATLSEEVTSVTSLLAAKYNEPPVRERTLEVIKSRYTVEDRLQDHLANASEFVGVCLAVESLDLIREALRSAVERGVFVVLLLDGEPENPVVPDLAHIARIHRELDTAFLTADREVNLVVPTSMITTSSSDDEAVEMRCDRCRRWLNRGILIDIWASAEPYGCVPPAPLPSTFSDFRRATLQAALHDRAGHDLSVSATGHTIERGETRTVEGPLNDVSNGLLDRRIDTDHVYKLRVDTVDGVRTLAEPPRNGSLRPDDVQLSRLDS